MPLARADRDRHHRTIDGTILAASEYVNIVALKADRPQRDDSKTSGTLASKGKAEPTRMLLRASTQSASVGKWRGHNRGRLRRTLVAPGTSAFALVGAR
jgi:hypothetical protein